ncbi:Crp/Fnr family transcriptional regulator [Desulfobacter latus]|uniref:Cyclic nucleotide-binding domain-containing protein n=1 Tax=Desulfobacter latus TaxID=2292 RepID=A0A850T8A7_9BACT|nr:cyclic nucleotide-binding domain-containing protein [Desulfobacter latus]NWH05385.1 cyclic nucleotide-binding domain-containing protein [Desulfobacter latus]
MIKIEDLKRINMLADMPDHLLKMISEVAQLNIYGKDTLLFSQGENIDLFYMIVMGQVALKVPLDEDIDVIFDILQAGRSLGSSAMLSDAKASYTAICQEPCEIMTLNGKTLQNLFNDNKEIGYYLMAGVAGQYKRTMDRRLRIILKTLEKHPELQHRIRY